VAVVVLEVFVASASALSAARSSSASVTALGPFGNALKSDPAAVDSAAAEAWQERKRKEMQRKEEREER
jgi:hypothetical protein